VRPQAEPVDGCGEIGPNDTLLLPSNREWEIPVVWLNQSDYNEQYCGNYRLSILVRTTLLVQSEFVAVSVSLCPLSGIPTSLPLVL
jgi:hypothetical protein